MRDFHPKWKFTLSRLWETKHYNNKIIIIRLEAFPGMLVVTGDSSRSPSGETLKHEYVVCR